MAIQLINSISDVPSLVEEVPKISTAEIVMTAVFSSISFLGAVLLTYFTIKIIKSQSTVGYNMYTLLTLIFLNLTLFCKFTL